VKRRQQNQKFPSFQTFRFAAGGVEGSANKNDRKFLGFAPRELVERGRGAKGWRWHALRAYDQIQSHHALDAWKGQSLRDWKKVRAKVNISALHLLYYIYMHLKRAIGISVLAYLASFVVGSVVGVLMGIDFAETQEIPAVMWYVGAVTSVVFSVLFAFWYFRSPKTTSSAKEGVKFGVVMILTGFALDIAAFLPLLRHEDPFGPILAYYGEPFFWISVLLVLAGATLAGKLKAKKN